MNWPDTSGCEYPNGCLKDGPMRAFQLNLTEAAIALTRAQVFLAGSSEAEEAYQRVHDPEARMGEALEAMTGLTPCAHCPHGQRK